MADPTANSNDGEQAQSQATPPDARVQELEAQVKEKEAKYLYLYAEFENFKKRWSKERSDLVRFGWESVARELLQISDNLDRALAFVPPSTDKNFVDGLRMVLSHFQGTLKKQGVEPIASTGQAFDPNLHEAVAQEPSELPEGTITREQARGYVLHGRLLRPAHVVVSSGPAAKNET